MARVVSVNVGAPRATQWRGRTVHSAIWKTPVDGPVRVAGVNLAGDDQADRRVHGGVDKAVYAYSTEDYAWWADTVGVAVGPASFGENLTTTGIDLRACSVGDRWRVGTVQLEVAQPREPCFKLGMRMGDDAFPDRFAAAGRPGAYFRIVTEGELGAGDAIEVTPSAEPSVALGDMVRGLSDAQWRLIRDDERFPPLWRHRAERALRL
ncbi:MAG TPA: MOSC domain-containing protein [Acidimicrobiales bacterium]|nr:MOSC domain-containing protein [Acidimicrobiales bacterium]